MQGTRSRCAGRSARARCLQQALHQVHQQGLLGLLVWAVTPRAAAAAAALRGVRGSQMPRADGHWTSVSFGPALLTAAPIL